MNQTHEYLITENISQIFNDGREILKEEKEVLLSLSNFLPAFNSN